MFSFYNDTRKDFTRKEVEAMFLLIGASKAQGLVEYALILVFVFLVVVIMLALFGPAVGNMYSNVISQI